MLFRNWVELIVVVANIYAQFELLVNFASSFFHCNNFLKVWFLANLGCTLSSSCRVKLTHICLRNVDRSWRMPLKQSTRPKFHAFELASKSDSWRFGHLSPWHFFKLYRIVRTQSTSAIFPTIFSWSQTLPYRRCSILRDPNTVRQAIKPIAFTRIL